MTELSAFLAQHAYLTSSMLVVIILLFIIEWLRAKRATFMLKPTEVTQKINHDNAVIIDIRVPDAYKKGHILDALSLSSKALRDDDKALQKLKTKPVIIVCGNGMESQKLAAILFKRGYNAYSLSGGIRAWIDAQMPIVKE